MFQRLPKFPLRRSACNLTLRMFLRCTIGLVSFFALCPAQSPDYTNKVDILNGRRVLLQVDDIVLFGEEPRAGTQFHDMGFNFYNSTNSSFSAPKDPPIADTSVVPGGQRSLVISGRWWDSATDIPALIFSNILKQNDIVLLAVLDRRSNDKIQAVVPEGGETETPCGIAGDFTGDGYDDLVLATTPPNGGEWPYCAPYRL
jgi:hypothetical protein